MQFSVDSDLKRFKQDLTDIQKKQLPFATSVALNNTAVEVHEEEIKLMKSVFDRPTPFILKALRVKRSTKANPFEATVGFKDVFGRFGEDVEKVLTPQIDGGPRALKGSERTLRRMGILRSNEYIVPSRALRLNKFGNIPAGTMNKILSNIGAQSDSKQNTQASKRTMRYVVGEVGGTRGIWHVMASRWRPVLIFVNNRPTYKKRFKFFELAEKIQSKSFSKHMDKALQRALDTAKGTP